jgi:hypothetical protein
MPNVPLSPWERAGVRAAPRSRHKSHNQPAHFTAGARKDPGCVRFLRGKSLPTNSPIDRVRRTEGLSAPVGTCCGIQPTERSQVLVPQPLASLTRSRQGKIIKQNLHLKRAKWDAEWDAQASERPAPCEDADCSPRAESRGGQRSTPRDPAPLQPALRDNVFAHSRLPTGVSSPLSPARPKNA